VDAGDRVSDFQRATPLNLDHIQARIRTRSAWEAIDLGFVFARKWFWQLWLAWVMLALPVFIIAHLLFLDTLWLAPVILWWFKPLFEQPLLFILSRQLFGENIEAGYLRRNIFTIVKPQLLPNLLWRRFSVHRSFNNPVAMLEGLNGRARNERLTLLHRQQRLSSWLTIIGVHIESVFNFSLIIFVSLLIPDTADLLDFTDFFNELSDQYQFASWISNLAYFLSLSVFAPFYVAGGFSLYLSSRVKLEGWEIEIAFKRLKKRLQKLTSSSVAMVAFCALLVGFLMPLTPALAQTDSSATTDMTAQDAREIIGQVLRQPDFGEVETVTRWRIRPTDSPETFDLPSWLKTFVEWLVNLNVKPFDMGAWSLASILEAVMWLGLLIIVVYLWKTLYPRLSARRGGKMRPSARRQQSAAITLLSERLNLHELPSDIEQQALLLIEQGDDRQALSLLYRGALQATIQRDDIDIPASATESDCHAIIAQARPAQEAHFFEQLTRQWLASAYAHASPAREDLLQLCRDWQSVYLHGSR
jgi:hypothetical protein